MKAVYKNAMLNNEITDITVCDGIIENIAKTDASGIDLNGGFVHAGLIDIHSHGCIGFDTMEGNLREMSRYMALQGTTSWLPTTMTMDFETIRSATSADIDFCDGAKVLGFHLEGPYISKKYKGSQNEKYIKNPDIDEFNSLQNIKMITIAPELCGAFDFIKKCSAVVSLGHTDCDYETAIKAIDCGAACLTHTFNAMPPFHHRKPSLIGAAIVKNSYVQVICDGVHLHKAAVLALYKIFGADRMILISDSMRAQGLCDGEYQFGGQKIIVSDSVAKTVDGVIAGGTSTLHSCVKKAIEFGIPEEDAYKMASSTPARLLGINRGEIKPGYIADFIVTDNKNIIKAVIIQGNIFSNNP